MIATLKNDHDQEKSNQQDTESDKAGVFASLPIVDCRGRKSQDGIADQEDDHQSSSRAYGHPRF